MKKYSGLLVAFLAIALGYAYGRKQRALRLEREARASSVPQPEPVHRPAASPMLMPVPSDLPTDQNRPDSIPKVIQ